MIKFFLFGLLSLFIVFPIDLLDRIEIQLPINEINNLDLFSQLISKINEFETGQVIKLRHPKSGFYRMNFEKYIPNNTSENIIDFSQSKSLSSNGVDSIDNTPSAEVNLCVACGSKKTYAIADCGCSLCYDDYKIARGDKEKIKCKIHNVFLSSNITFEIYKSNIKGNALDKLGLSKCPVCKINDGTQSFNCGCNMKVCEKCFNDNVYVLKYNQCPGCGMPYVPLKKTKKKKSKEEKKSDFVNDMYRKFINGTGL